METPESDELPLGYEQPDRWDRLIAFILTLATAFALWAFSSSALPPSLWDELAVSARLVPPDSIFPGVARNLEAGIFYLLGLPAGVPAIRFLGLLFGGVAAGCFYLILRELFPAVLLLRSVSRAWTFRQERIVAIVGTLVFARALPVWNLGLVFSADMFLLVLTLVFLRGFLRLLHYGRLSTAYGCLFLLGVFTAESPAGLLFTLFAALTVMVAQRYAWRPDLRYLNLMLVEFSKWRLSAFYLLGFLSALLAQFAFFALNDGMAALKLGYPETAVHWLIEYARTMMQAATPLGWMLLSAFAVVPFVVAVLNARHATDDDAFLSFKQGLIFMVLFFVSLAPLTSLPHLRFWAWTARPCVNSPYLLALACCGLALAFSLSLAVLAFDLWCRNHHRIAIQRFPDLAATDDVPAGLQHFHFRWRKLITFVALLLLAWAMAPGRQDAATRAITGCLAKVVRETVRELAGAKAVITDGAFDNGLRLAAAVRGERLQPLSIMSGRQPYEMHVRLLAAANEEEKALLELGTAEALRNWAANRSPRWNEIGLQLGFELWRGNPAGRPPVGGLAAFPRFTPAEASEYAAAARGLAEEVLAIHESGAFDACEDRRLKDKLLHAQWRLARMAELRGQNPERAQSEEARKEEALAEKLDALNPELQRVRDAVNWMRNREGGAITPREGLRIALERADFALARRYAIPILNVESSNPDANFGMGMSYFIEDKYARAEEYLKAALRQRPKEPATLNNLAICCFKLRRYREALEYSKKALELLPDAPAVRQTYEEIKKQAASEP